MRHTNSGEHQRATMSRANTPRSRTHANTHTHTPHTQRNHHGANVNGNPIISIDFKLVRPTPLARDNAPQNGNRVPPFGMTWRIERDESDARERTVLDLYVYIYDRNCVYTAHQTAHTIEKTRDSQIRLNAPRSFKR